MMLRVDAILGDAGEERFAGRAVERVAVDAHDASKRRLRLRGDAGTDLAIDLPRGSFLADGAVLADDGRRLVVVERTPEDALIVRLSSELPPAELAAAAARLGHAFGNQHVPIEVEGLELRAPVTTSREIAAHTVEQLGLDGVAVDFARIPLWRTRPPQSSHH